MAILAQLSTNEALKIFETAQVAIIPTGAIEQHGPHLDLQTDIAIATQMAADLESRLGDSVVLCPPLPYGVSEHHMNFAGTITLSPQTFVQVILEICESLSKHGIKKVFVLNGHGGNIDPLNIASREALRKFNIKLAHSMWAQLASDVVRERMEGQWRYNHACEVETSLAMHVVPHIVRKEKLEKGDVYDNLDTYLDPPHGKIYMAKRFDDWTKNGALGDARNATIEFGEEILSVSLTKLEGFLKEFAEQQN